MRFRLIRLAAPYGINREQQVMQQNQKLGTQPNAKCGIGRTVPSGFKKILKIFRAGRNFLAGAKWTSAAGLHMPLRATQNKTPRRGRGVF
jgi:hypothetical protein